MGSEKAATRKRRADTVATASVFLLVFFGYNTMVFSEFLGATQSLMIVTGVALLNLLRMLSRKLVLRTPRLLTLLLLSANIFFTMLFAGDGGNGNYLLILKMLLAVIVVSVIPFEVFRVSFANVMTFLGAYSILCTHILSRLPVRYLVPTFQNSTGITFFNFGFANVVDFPGYYRNFGIFTEPGIYVCYLIPALIFAMRDTSRMRGVQLFKIITLTLALISTFSPVGVVSAFVIFGLNVVLNVRIPAKARILLLALFAAIAVAIFQDPNWSGGINDSTAKMTEQQSSYVGRSYVLEHNVGILLESPILGKGLTNVIDVIDVRELQAIANSNTSTTTLYMAVYGLGFGCVSAIPLYFTLRFGKAATTLAAFAAFLWAINSQALFHSEFLWYLIFYGIAGETAAIARFDDRTSTGSLNISAASEGARQACI